MPANNAPTRDDPATLDEAPGAFRGHSIRRYALLGFVFLAIWSVKLAVIDRYGTDIPYWDQWAKEGELMYAPWFERHAFWRPLFVPHNEHRIAPTLALNLGLLRLGGDQWDARVQCVASAALHALLIAALVGWALRNPRRISGRGSKLNCDPAAPLSPPNALPPKWAAIGLALFVVLIAAPPIAWENILGGFQSQFYFLAGFSLLAIGWLLGSAPTSWRWYAGLLAAALACVSMGSGMLVAFPIAVVAAHRFLRRLPAGTESADARRPAAQECRRWNRRASLATFALALAVGGIGWWFRPHAPWNAGFHAHAVIASLLYAARCLAWPLYDQPWLAAIFWAPWAALVWRWSVHFVLRPPTSEWRRDQPAGRQRTQDFIVAGGLWVLVQVAAITYSRSGLPGPPAPRYGDIFALGLAFNAFSLLWLAGALRNASEPGADAPEAAGSATVTPGADVAIAPLARTAEPAPAKAAGGSKATCRLMLVWAAAVAVAVGFATRDVFRDALPRKRAEAIAYERNVHAFVLTDDYATFEKASPIPFPMADWLARILRNPTLRRLLPQSLREPVSIPSLGDGRRGVAGLPPLEHRRTRTLVGPGQWQSEPLPVRDGWWKIEMAGDTNTAGAELDLRAVSDGHQLARIAPSKPAGNSWRAAYVRAPREPARLYARVTAPADTLAFSEPIEMSSLSFWTWRLAEHAGWLMAFAALGLAGVAKAIADPRSRNATPASRL